MRKRSSLSTSRPTFRPLLYLSALLFPFCLCGFLHPAFSQERSSSAAELPNSPASQNPVPRLQGAITGSVNDQDGDSILGAKVTLSFETQAPTGDRQTVSGDDGSFSFTNVAAGSFVLTITAPGFTAQRASGSLQPGEQAEIPVISMRAAAAIDIEVTASRHDIAQDQMAAEEKQRVFGVIPNFYVSYISDPAPLAADQKFAMAWKVSVDPVNFIVTGIIAGAQQSQNTFGGYGQGAQGYAKRYGAAYADGFISTMLSNAVLPVLFKQDPRYFYKGRGSIQGRALYAIASTVICKGDNGRWQPNYSSVLGNFVAGGISNLYYPSADRDGIRLTVGDTLIGLAAGAGGNLFQEFFLRRMTPHVRHPLRLAPK